MPFSAELHVSCLLLLLTCFFHSQGLDPFCGDGLISDGYCLRLYHNYVEWSKAKEACEAVGSELVNITISSDLLNAARLLLIGQSVGEIWISAHSAKRWLWVDGTEVTEFKWAPNEPNALKSNEDKLMLLQGADFLWSDNQADCHSEYQQINKALCEYRTSSCYSTKHPYIKIAGSCLKLIGKYAEHFYNDNHCNNANHCWDGGMSYNEAARRCRDSGGRLAVLNTSEKIEKTIEYIKSKVVQNEIYSGNYWIGASVDHTKQPQWDTPVDKLRGYDSRYIAQHGVTMFYGKTSRYRITATDCCTKLPYICISGKLAVFGGIPVIKAFTCEGNGGYSPKTTTQPNNSTRRTLHSTAHNLTTSNSAKITPDKIMPSATKIPETKAAKMTFSTAERTMTPSPNRTTGSPDSFHSTTLTAPKSTCISRSITKQLDKGSRTLRLEVEPGRFLTLPAGDFVYEMKDMCSINITIKAFYRADCPGNITGVVSPRTGLATFDINTGPATHRLNLPVGKYRYQILQDGRNCDLTVSVKDYSVLRRLVIKAQYDVSYQLLDDQITLRTLKSLAISHFTQVMTICCPDCGAAEDEMVTVSCSGSHHLSVSWPTNITYTADVVNVPADLTVKLRQRIVKLQKQVHIFQLVILNRQPP